MIPSPGQAGLDQEGAELVAVQAEDGRLVTEPGTPHIGRRVVDEELFFDAVPVEPCDCGQASGDCRSCSVVVFEPAGEQFDVGPPHIEQTNALLVTPTDVFAEILLIRQPRVPRIPRQESTQRQLHLKVTIVTAN